MKRQYLHEEPFFLQWHITNKCNLSCAHCYNSSRQTDDLPLKDLLRILDKYELFLKSIARQGRIHITGGEPFLSPHLFTILNKALSKNIQCRILSNGTAITKESAGRLTAAGCGLVQISVDGDRAANDRIRGEGAFQQAVGSMRLLRVHGIEVTVNMTVSDVNVNDVEKVMGLASEAADRFTFSRFVPIDKDKPMDAGNILSHAELHRCFRKVFSFKTNCSRIDIPLRDPLWHAFMRVPPGRYQHAIHGCSAGFNGLTVAHDGTLYPCRRLPLPIGNILINDPADVWNNSPILEKLRNRDLLKGKCRTCKSRWICGGCRAVAYAVKGDYLEEDPQCHYGNSLIDNWLSSIKQVLRGVA